MVSPALVRQRLRWEVAMKVLTASFEVSELGLSLVGIDSQLAKLLRMGRRFSCNCLDIYIISISSRRLVSKE